MAKSIVCPLYGGDPYLGESVMEGSTIHVACIACDITDELISMNTLYVCIIGGRGGRGGFTPRGRGRGGERGRGFGSGRGKEEICVLL